MPGARRSLRPRDHRAWMPGQRRGGCTRLNAINRRSRPGAGRPDPAGDRGERIRDWPSTGAGGGPSAQHLQPRPPRHGRAIGIHPIAARQTDAEQAQPGWRVCPTGDGHRSRHSAPRHAGGMMMRSLLFVPADGGSKLDKAFASGADAIILDLEDSIAHERKDAARASAAAFLRNAVMQAERPRLLVRVNGIATGLTDADLDAVVPARPDAILLPKADGGASVIHADAKLAA